MKPGAPSAHGAGLERGDHVYVQHPERGAMAVRVLATGKDGFTGECSAGRRHRLPWNAYVGHRKRIQTRYQVVDQGADGALVEDDKGRRRYLAGEVPTGESNPDDPAPPRSSPCPGRNGVPA